MAIGSFGATVGLHAVERRGEEPYVESQPWLELRGPLNEPVNKVRDVLVSVYPQDSVEAGTARPAAVGAIVQMRPEMSGVVSFQHGEFDRLWQLALLGHLKDAKHVVVRYEPQRVKEPELISAVGQAGFTVVET